MRQLTQAISKVATLFHSTEISHYMYNVSVSIFNLKIYYSFSSILLPLSIMQ